MSFALDANILIYASHPESPHYEATQRFLAECVERRELLCLAWQTVTAYLRVSTHVGLFGKPLDPATAAENIDALLRRPRTRVLVEQDGFWELYRELLETHRARANFVHDVHLAALLRQHGVKTLYTRDRDFRRFEFLDVRDPLES